MDIHVHVSLGMHVHVHACAYWMSTERLTGVKTPHSSILKVIVKLIRTPVGTVH